MVPVDNFFGFKLNHAVSILSEYGSRNGDVMTTGQTKKHKGA